MRRGATLIEGLIVLVLCGVVLGSILTFLYNSQTWTARGSEHATALVDLRVGLERMTRELREGRMLAYPAVGQAAQPGLGLVNARNESVVYRLEANPAYPAAPFDLVRVTVGQGGSREVVARQITRLLVTAADGGAGRDPVVARFLITRAISGPDSGVSLMGSACIRSPRPGCLAVR